MQYSKPLYTQTQIHWRVVGRGLGPCLIPTLAQLDAILVHCCGIHASFPNTHWLQALDGLAGFWWLLQEEVGGFIQGYPNYLKYTTTFLYATVAEEILLPFPYTAQQMWSQELEHSFKPLL